MVMYCKNCGDEDSVEAKGELFVCSKCGTEYTKAEMQKIFSEYIFDMIGEIENSVNTIMENPTTVSSPSKVNKLYDEIIDLYDRSDYYSAVEKCNEFFQLKDASDYYKYSSDVNLLCSYMYFIIACIDADMKFIDISIVHLLSGLKELDESGVETEIDNIIDKRENVVDKLENAIIRGTGIECDDFVKDPSDDKRDRLYTVITIIREYKKRFNEKLADYYLEIDASIDKKIADALNLCALNACNNIQKQIVDYIKIMNYGDKLKLINSIVNCCAVEKYAMSFVDDIRYSKNFILILKNVQAIRTFMQGTEVSSTNEIVTELNKEMKKYGEKVKAVEPNYEIPYIYVRNQGCYVATAVYGSYDCPQVWTLRRYRDNTLANTWYGRAFIHTYYAISPTLVKWFGKTKWFRKLWKGKLDKMVARLQAQGVESTPYNDKKW